MADTSVKFFHSAQLAAPSVADGAGGLIGLLDAVLVNGFGLVTVSSIVIASNVATVNCTTPHSLEPNGVALIAGVGSPAALNGEQRVLTITTNAFTFATTGISDQTVSGSFTAKVAPLGWGKPYNGTNLAAYRPADTFSTRPYLRVDDTPTGSNAARVRGYESMSDVNTGTGPFPTTGQASNGLFWPHRTTALWFIVGDSRGFYYGHNYYGGGSGFNTMWFGDPTTFKAGDGFHACIAGCAADPFGSGTAGYDLFQVRGSPVGGEPLYAARGHTQIGGSSDSYRTFSPWIVASGDTNSRYSGAQGSLYPDAVVNGLRLSQALIHNLGSIRGLFPGLYPCMQSIVTSMSHLDRIDGQGDLAGRKLVAILTGSYLTNSSPGIGFIDITGPWR